MPGTHRQAVRDSNLGRAWRVRSISATTKEHCMDEDPTDSLSGFHKGGDTRC
jgi:hypothetical protein